MPELVLLLYILLGSTLKAVLPIVMYVTVAWSVCLSVTVVHPRDPATAIECNQVPFSRDTHVEGFCIHPYTQSQN